MSFVRCSGPFLKWTSRTNGPKSKKNNYAQGFTPESWHRLYMSREEGKELASIEDSVDASIQWFEEYTKKNLERLITTTSNSNGNKAKQKTTKIWKQKCVEKQLYGYFKRQTAEIEHGKAWTWQRKGILKKETKSLLTAVQNNAQRGRLAR